MNPVEQERLDELLREQHRYVADDGFSARVVAALPPRRARWHRAFLLGATAVGWVAAMVWLPLATLPPLKLSALLAFSSEVLVPWAVMVCIAGCLTWAMVRALQCGD